MAADCAAAVRHDLSHAECLEMIAGLACRAAAEYLPLERAVGRFAAAPVLAHTEVPAAAIAAVDGYAFASDVARRSGNLLPVSGRAAAGDRTPALEPGTAMRIFTGATIPDGADTVAMQERCTVDSGMARLPDDQERGANIRLPGEDLRAGDMVVENGAQLRPQELAALASLGTGEVLVRAPVRLALLSSGSELLRPGAPPRAGAIFDSNRIMLKSLAASLPVTISDHGVAPDHLGALVAALDITARAADLIVTSGGASHGEEDHVAAAILRLGSLHFRGAAIRPGRPFAMGRIGTCTVLALPGNPAAAFTCFLLYGRPAITRIGGGAWREPARLLLPAAFSWQRRRPGRREFLRGRIEAGPDGTPCVRGFERDSSALISSLRHADGLIEIGEEIDAVAEGTPVPFLPFERLGIPC